MGSEEAAREAAGFVEGAQSPREERATSAATEGAGLYQLLVESVQDYAIFALDPAGNVLSWNAGAKRLKGYTREEILGRHFSIFYPPEDLAAGKPAWELEVAARDGRLEDEGWRLRKDGTPFWANVVITALRGPAGELVGFAKVTRDLTDRRQAEEELRRSEERLRLLVHSVKDYAIFMLDPEGYVNTWNEGAERAKGYTEQEIVGRHFSIFYPPESRDMPARLLEEARREGRVEDEGWRVRKDGTRFWADVVITALRDPAGELVGFAKVTRDLTDRRRAEEELRRSEERLRLLVHSVKDYAIFMLDPEGYVNTWNEGAERAKGYAEREIVGRHFSLFYPPEDRDKPPRLLEEARREGRVEDEGWRVRKDGTRFWADVVITALRDERGELVGFAKVTRDLTDRRDAELRTLEAVRRAAQAETANVAKSQFLAAMSHELRTPLNAIGGYVDLLEIGIGGPVTDVQRGYLDKIQRSQRHLLGIINDLLNFSRIEAGQIVYERTPVPLRQCVDTIVSMLEQQAAEKGIELTLASCPEGIAALGDAAKIDQVVLNLCSNALKFTPAGGRVEVVCESRGDQVAVLVSDTGVGISPDQIERIFEPFVQLGRDFTNPQEGTGLGLAISRDLARGMGGDLTVRSEVGTGSTFVLTLPAAG